MNSKTLKEKVELSITKSKTIIDYGNLLKEGFITEEEHLDLIKYIPKV
tara:strand:- start:294 stop:437 length:144 start_codon:yes stop_codon:yes gene_type:complete